MYIFDLLIFSYKVEVDKKLQEFETAREQKRQKVCESNLSFYSESNKNIWNSFTVKIIKYQ